MRIVVCVKHVPDAQSDRGFDPDDHTVDRSVDGLLSELDEYAVEEALVVAAAAEDSTVTALTVGPDAGADALRKALQMGADAAVHVNDLAVHGSDAIATSRVIAAALRTLGATEPIDLIITGMASTDGVMGVVPAMVAERLDLPAVTFASELAVADGVVRARRDGDAATQLIEAPLPALVSVTDQINEPRYPSFKGIMGAKKKPVTTWSLADIGLTVTDAGVAASVTAVTAATPRPPRAPGVVVTDEGDGGQKLAAFLVDGRFI